MIGRRRDGIMAADRHQEPDRAMAQWYYSDEERNRHGPLDAAAMIALHQRGELGPDALVWRDGLNQWRPWRELAGELVAAPGFAASDAAEQAAQAEQASAERTAAAVAAAQARAETRAAQDPGAAATFAASSAAVATSAAAAPAAESTTSAAPTSAPAATAPHSPYSAPRAAVAETSQVVLGGEVVEAGFWRRAAAYLIDSTLVGIAYYALFTALVVLVLVSGLFGEASSRWLEKMSALSVGITVLSYALYGVVSLLYYAGLESSSMQATLGKLAVGIKVVDRNGARLSRGRALGRWASAGVSYLTLGVGFLMAAFTERKRGLHDMIAGTQVVDRWAYTARPEMQRRELGPVTWVVLILGGLIWLGLTGFIVGVMMLGLR